MSDLAHDLQRVAERGPRLDAALVVRRAMLRAAGETSAETHDRRFATWRLAAVAGLVAVMVGAIALASGTRDAPGPSSPSELPPTGTVSVSSNPLSSTPELSTPGLSPADPSVPGASAPVTGPDAPVGTAIGEDAAAILPDTDDVIDVPVTAFGSSPPSWYRLVPDLDLSWSDPGTGPSKICWRTVDGSDCIDDTAQQGDLVFVTPAGDRQLAVFIRPADGQPFGVTLRFADGTAESSELTWNDTIGWGVVRYVPRAAEVTSFEFVW